jgi:hypothetical protein
LTIALAESSEAERSGPEPARAPYEPTREEIETAVADAECRKRSEVAAVEAEVRTQYQRKAVRGNEAELLQWQQRQEDFRPRSRELLGDAAVDEFVDS